MLVLSRKPGQTIEIGDDIVIHLIEGDQRSGSRWKIGIDAPREVSIRRGELSKRDANAEERAA